MRRSTWWVWCAWGVCLAFVATGCAEAPVAYSASKPSTDVINLRLGYPEAFERVVQTLEHEGYKIDVADDRVGLIRTVPKTHAGTGGVAYQTAVVVRMGGTGRASWLAVDDVAMPTLPDEERKIKDLLKGIAP